MRGAGPETAAASDAPFGNNGGQFIGHINPDGLNRADPDTGVAFDTSIMVDMEQRCYLHSQQIISKFSNFLTTILPRIKNNPKNIR